MGDDGNGRADRNTGADRLTWFNELPSRAAQQMLLECCSAPRWAELMAAARPYSSLEGAVRQSSVIVATLTVAELTEALAGHPRIGERPAAGDGAHRAAQGAAAWSAREQSGVDADGATTKQALAEANLEYEERFGHIYLVCASGRTGTELLEVLRRRLQNEPDDEWQVVRAELQKINALRLQRLVAGLA
jgi:2-oxo-4-hydroxy-4-carboxy-5-ureidoimidazoline decarboxylase